MKTLITISIVITAIIIASCSTSKKSTTPAVATSTSPANNATLGTSAMPNFTFAKPADGIYEPGNDELTAIQAEDKNITLSKLNEGFVLYTKGACINCHHPKNIYKIENAECKGLIANMAKKAKISDEQHDAVYKYVLSIKAAKAAK